MKDGSQTVSVMVRFDGRVVGWVMVNVIERPVLAWYPCPE
jgi:hypothetical protein